MSTRLEVLRIIKQQLKLRVIPKAEDALCVLGADSISMVDIAISVETLLGHDVPDKEVLAWRTVEDVIAYAMRPKHAH